MVLSLSLFLEEEETEGKEKGWRREEGRERSMVAGGSRGRFCRSRRSCSGCQIGRSADVDTVDELPYKGKKKNMRYRCWWAT